MTSTDRPAPLPARPGSAAPSPRRLASFDDFRSAQEIHDLLGSAARPSGWPRSTGPCSALAEAGEVDMLRTEDGEAIYRRCSDSHHHHLVCRSCGAHRRGRGAGRRALDPHDRGRARLRRRQPHPGDLRHLPDLRYRQR